MKAEGLLSSTPGEQPLLTHKSKVNFSHPNIASLLVTDAPGVTHQIQPFGPKGDPDDGVQYMRNLGKRSAIPCKNYAIDPDTPRGLPYALTVT